MKIKGLLIVLPALMVLAGCSNKPIATKNEFVEDTLAHEEIFGGVSAQKHELGKQMPNNLKGDGEFYKPVVFWQQKDNNDGTCSIRFVAAIEDETTSAVWTRSVHTIDGDFKKEKDNFEVTTVYETVDTSRNPGVENRESATNVEAEEDGTKPFSYFAIYCLLNIPYVEAENYYLDAYITVSNGTKTKISDVGSLNVVYQTKHLKYSLGDENRYIYELYDSSSGTYSFVESNVLEGTNYFNVSGKYLNDGDSFVFHYIDFDNDALTYSFVDYGYEALRESSNFYDDGSGFITVAYHGTYSITLTDSEIIQIKKLYYFEGPSWWWNNYTETVAELRNNDDDETCIEGGRLYYVESEGEHRIYSGYVEDSSYYNQIQFYRNTTESGYEGNFNHTGFVEVPTDGSYYYKHVELGGDYRWE